MNIEELRKGLSRVEFEMLISRKGEVNAREVHLWGHEAEDIAATIVRLREDYEKLRRETKPTHTDLMVPPETIEVAGGWEIEDDDGTHKIVPLTSDGCRLVGDMVRRVEALTAELAATRDAWADKYAARGIALDAANTRAQKAEAAYRGAEASVKRKLDLIEATSKRLVEMHVAHTVSGVEIDHLRERLKQIDDEAVRIGQVDEPCAIDVVKKLRQLLDDARRDYGRWLNEAIDQRDAHEERLNDIRDSLGLDCEWSNACDVGAECVKEIEAMRAQLHRSQATCAAMRAEWEVHAHDCPQNPSFIERATTYRAGKIVDRYTISRGDPCDCGFKPFPSEIGRDFVSLFRNLRDAASTLLATIVVRATPAAGSDVDTACKILNDVVVQANKKLGDQ